MRHKFTIASRLVKYERFVLMCVEAMIYGACVGFVAGYVFKMIFI